VSGPTTLITDRNQSPLGTHYHQVVSTGSTLTNFFLQVGVSPPITDPSGLQHLKSPLLVGFETLTGLHQLDLEPLLPGNAYFAVGLVFDKTGKWETFVVPFTTLQRHVVIEFSELHIIKNGHRFGDLGHRHAQFWIWVREGDKTVDSKFFGDIDSFSINDDQRIQLETLPVSATAIGPEKVTPANHDLGILIRGLASHTEDDDEPCANYFPAEQFPDDVNVRTPPGAKFHIPTGIGEGVYEPFVVRAKPHIDGNEFEFEIKSIVVIAYI
jgi:hypothetical protein